MKKINLPGKISIVFTLMMLVLLSNPLFAQRRNTAEIKIKTSAQCDMCKKTIEQKVLSERGVKKASLNLDSKIVTITYNPKRTSPERLRKVISEAGYDADDVPAVNRANQKLNDCNKKRTDK